MDKRTKPPPDCWWWFCFCMGAWCQRRRAAVYRPTKRGQRLRTMIQVLPKPNIHLGSAPQHRLRHESAIKSPVWDLAKLCLRPTAAGKCLTIHKHGKRLCGRSKEDGVFGGQVTAIMLRGGCACHLDNNGLAALRRGLRIVFLLWLGFWCSRPDSFG